MTRQRGRTILAGAVLVAATGLSYSPALHAGFVWDDDSYVTQNGALRTTDGLRRIWFQIGATPQYYPLVFTSFWFEYQTAGLDARVYHAVNAGLHALAAVLLWRVLLCLNVPGAWLAAALFALHPVHVESVAWITERKNVLSAALALAAILAYLRYAGIGGGTTPCRLLIVYAAALMLFIAAMLAKTVTCTLPAVIILLLWWKRRRLTRADMLPLLPFFIIGAALGLLTAWVEKRHVRAEGADWILSFGQRCLIAGRALWFYAGKLAWPTHLTFIYPRWQITTDDVLAWVYPAAFASVVVVLWLLRKRLGPGPFVAVLIFAVVLFPALGFLDVYPFRYSFVADHFQYHASMALLALASAAVTMLAARSQRGPLIVAAVAAIVLTTCGALTWRRTLAYRDAETLWRDTIRKNPECWMACNNLANLLSRQGRLPEAMELYRSALRTRPDDPQLLKNLGIFLTNQRRAPEAIDFLSRAVQLDPDDAEACHSLGLALWHAQRSDESLAAFANALRLRPAYARAHSNYALALADAGRFDEACDHCRDALRQSPSFVEARNNLAVICLRMGRLSEAAGELLEVVNQRPDFHDARFNLAVVLARLGRMPEAIVEMRDYLRAQPGDARAKQRLEEWTGS